MSLWVAGIIFLIVKLLVVLVALLLFAAYLIYVERRLLGFLQLRLGPNRAGPLGLLQPIADAVKLLTKEDLIPAGADRVIFLYAPVVVAGAAILIFAVVPFGQGWTFRGHPIPGVVTDLNVGLLYVYALVLHRGLRRGPGRLGLQFQVQPHGGDTGRGPDDQLRVGPGAVAGPHRHAGQILQPGGHRQRPGPRPFILWQPVAFIIFFVSSVAEMKRIPFDIPEAENELVAGYHTEYSGMRFGLFFLGEYVTMVTLGALVAVFFLGGWRGPFLPPLLWFLIKVVGVVFVIIWIRGTLPRLRYDQLMHLGWKLLIPVALINIMVTGGIMLAWGIKSRYGRGAT